MNHDALIEFARDLIRLPSLSGDEERVALRVQAEMRAVGFDHIEIDANGSVVGIINGAQTGMTLLLDAHIDTVGVTAGAIWRHDPFAATVEDDVIYGRGSADMKGALAAMIHAVAAFPRQELRGRVAVSASTLEEVLEGVTLRTIMDATSPDVVVIGEATDLHINHGGRGRAEIRIETMGRPAHSSSPQLGRNAVLDMAHLIRALEQITLPTDRLLGPAILALTDIISEPYPGHSVIPSRCIATYDRRLLPGETVDSVLQSFRILDTDASIEMVAHVVDGEHRAYTGREVHSQKFFPAWCFEGDEWFVRRAAQSVQGIGLSGELGAYRFCTNGAYSAGVAGVPTIGFGPGTEGDAHVIDEHIAIKDLLSAAAGYQAIVRGLLSTGA